MFTVQNSNWLGCEALCVFRYREGNEDADQYVTADRKISSLPQRDNDRHLRRRENKAQIAPISQPNSA
jgi:hypothetical protein